MKESEKYFIDGYTTGALNKTSSYNKFMSILESIKNRNLKQGFHLEQKYPYSLDLRPAAYAYDASLVDILFENNIPSLLEDTLGYELFLAHMQIRVAYGFPMGYTERSYMEWHRDTYFYDGQLTGNAPPVHKLIFYPKFADDTKKMLAVAKGTHLNLKKDRDLDYNQLSESEIDIIRSDNKRFILFNTSIFHSTLPASKQGDIRVIYNFCNKKQLIKYKEQNELHDLYDLKRKQNG